MTTYSPLDIERFMRKMRPEGTGCTEWLGWHNDQGYAIFYTYPQGTRRQARAHRVAWEIARGPVPEGLELDHLCRNRGCVSVEHLEAVTHRENTLRGESPAAMAARSDTCIRGHALSGENLRIEGSMRRCKTCHRDRQRAYYHQRKAMA